VLLSSNVSLNASDHGIGRGSFMQEQNYTHGIITIEDDVLIGAGVSVISNSKISEGAVISSNSLIKGDLPKLSVCAGIPAKVIRYR